MYRADISIVIPSWNSEATIRECLESVFAQRTDRRFEVVVVDSSSDRTAEVVKEFSEVKLIKLAKRTLSGAARNIGIAESCGPVVLFLDSDAIAEPDWIDKMLNWHEMEECSAVAGAVLNGNPESLVSWASYITEFSEYLPRGIPRYALIGATANLSYKRSVLEKYGGFSEKLKQYVDTEFNCRLNAGGDKLLFVPGIHVHHKHRTRLGEYLRHEYNRGRSASAVRRRGYLSYSRLARCRLLCVLLAGPVFARLTYCNLSRFTKSRMLPLWKTLLVSPISILGQAAWSLGFLSESMYPRVQITVSEGQSVAPERICI